MHISIHHGPECTSLSGRGDLQPLDLASDRGRPFHGIAPLGLIAWLDEQRDGPGLWLRCAARLFAVLDESDDLDPGLLAVRDAAQRAGVLSFNQSAQVALDYIGQYAAGAYDVVRLWATKEGHLSSVWEVDFRGGPRFVLNVARDSTAASVELDRTSRILRSLTDRAEVGVAEVEDLGQWGVKDHDPVTVTRNRLVSPALEIHRNGDEFMLVSEFLTDEGDPARIRAIRGRRATAAQASAIHAASAVLAGVDIAVEIDDGDLVWDGERPVLVAVS
jgi:hypothetical protein